MKQSKQETVRLLTKDKQILKQFKYWNRESNIEWKLVTEKCSEQDWKRDICEMKLIQLIHSVQKLFKQINS